MERKMFTYKKAGVDINKAQKFVNNIKKIQKQTEIKNKLLNKFGLFSTCFDLKKYNNPVIAASCDGIGTKIELLKKYDMWETAGWDLVAMNVNDIITTLAEPVMFLDYIGTSSINQKKMFRIIKGIKEACLESECILGGGETAEMPGVIPSGNIELIGFCIGAEEKENLINTDEIKHGNIVVGLDSTGFHSNGFSLIRKIIEQNKNYFSDTDIKKILTKTKIYFKEIKYFKNEKIKINGIAHITGSGISGNLSRIIPNGLRCEIEIPKIKNNSILKILEFLEFNEAINVFNLGIGIILIIDKNDLSKIENKYKNKFNKKINILGQVTKIRYKNQNQKVLITNSI